MSEYFRFSLQIDLSVDVRCVDGHVAEPRADGVDVDTGVQQMRGGCTPDGVRTNGPAEQRRMRS